MVYYSSALALLVIFCTWSLSIKSYIAEGTRIGIRQLVCHKQINILTY